jgi:hypothetical protein
VKGGTGFRGQAGRGTDLVTLGRSRWRPIPGADGNEEVPMARTLLVALLALLSTAAGPDPAVIAQVRGDRNRVFLMN